MPDVKLNSGHSLYLNAARGLAAMAVLFGHASILFLENGILSRTKIEKAGVLVFFLLSGFLITYSVVKKHRDPDYGFREFFFDRFARIYAAFLPALCFVWLVDLQSVRLPVNISPLRLEALTWIADFSNNMTIPTWFGNALMLQDFPLFQIARRLGIPESRWFIDEYGSGSPFWTISIEWWIYMIFGFVAICKVKQGLPIGIWQWLLVAFVAIEPYYYFVGGTDNCLTLLWLMGMLVALLFVNREVALIFLTSASIKRRWVLTCVAVSLFGLVSMLARLYAIKYKTGKFDFAEFQFGVFLAITLFGMLFAAGGLKSVPSAVVRFVDFVADYSFSLYLTHATVLTYIYLRFPGNDNSIGIFWMSILLCNVVAITFWWLFERHYRVIAIILKKRFPSRPKEFANLT